MTITNHKPLEVILDKVDETVDGKEASLKTVLAAFGDRAFGPVLTLSGLFMLTPIGAIPGAPIAFCIIIASFALQIILGRSRPWLPEKLNQIEITQDNIDTTRKYIEPALEKIDLIAKPRMAWAATEKSRLVAALLSLFLAASLVPLGAIPFGVLPSAIIIATLGMGIMARDGLLLLTGFGLSALAAALISTLIF